MTKYMFLFLLLFSVDAIPTLFHNCQNCYAVTSYEIIQHWKPSLNVSIKELMEITHQGCSGGDPNKILNKFFHGSKVHRGSLYKVIDLLKKKGPLIIDLNSQHLVTAWKATENGVLVHDSATGTKKIINEKNHPMQFKFITYPII